MGDEQTSTDAHSPSEPPVIPLWPWCVAKIKSKLHERAAEREKENSQDRFARRTANATVWIAILTVVTAIVGGLQYWTFQGQLVVMQGQLDEMRDEQRPWISYYAVPDSPLVFGNQVKGGAPFAGLTLKTTFTNVGHLPAQSVYSAANMLPWTTIDQPIKRRDEFCRMLKRREITAETAGYTFLPNESSSISHTVEITGFDLADWRRLKNGNLAIAGCVDYIFGSKKTHRKVGFIFELDRAGKPPQPLARIDPSEGNVLQADLRLFSNPRLPWDID